MKSIRIFVSLFFLVLFYSCQNDDFTSLTNTDESLDTTSVSTRCIKSGIKIAILSDIHVMDPSLLVKDGPAFQEYLTKDPKLLKFSAYMMQVTISKIIAQKPDLVLIAGDLTKDGERISHEKVAGMLRQFTSHGIKVVVTIGNHDVNNPEAVRYNNDKTTPVPTVQASNIPCIYANYGFKNAICKDPNSLSYVNEPINGLWIITIDANKYYLNTGTIATGSGVIKPETMTWVKAQLAKAQSKGKVVIGMMHHGLIEHFQGQQMLDYGYVDDNSDSDVNALIDAGLKIILTGHYHANDITKREYNGKFIFDVETGSLVNYPCSYRMLTVVGNTYSFTPQFPTALMAHVGTITFDNYAKKFFSDHLDTYFSYLLLNKFGVPAPYNSIFAPFFKAGAMAHFAGDEVYPPELPTELAYLNAADSSGTLSWALNTIWTDINTPDNTVTINMQTGVTY